MHLNKRLLPLAAGALLACSYASVTMAAEVNAATKQRGETEKIIREYLMKHPEVIRDALAQQQQRQAAVEAVAKKQALIAHRDELFNDPASPVLGNPSGDVTVVEFFDYRCGYCKRGEPAVKALLANDKQIRLVLKELPILGPDSLLAAKSALAARSMGRYEEFHTALMVSEKVDEAAIDALAASLGFDMARFHAERDSEATSAALDKTRALANNLGIEGTPAFIVGERLIAGAADGSTLAAHVNAVRLVRAAVSK